MDFKGLSIRFIRNGLGLTQARLAEEIGVTNATICNWENGKGKPSVENLKRISELSGIPMDLIYFAGK